MGDSGKIEIAPGKGVTTVYSTVEHFFEWFWDQGGTTYLEGCYVTIEGSKKAVEERFC